MQPGAFFCGEDEEDSEHGNGWAQASLKYGSFESVMFGKDEAKPAKSHGSSGLLLLGEDVDVVVEAISSQIISCMAGDLTMCTMKQILEDKTRAKQKHIMMVVYKHPSHRRPVALSPQLRLSSPILTVPGIAHEATAATRVGEWYGLHSRNSSHAKCYACLLAPSCFQVALQSKEIGERCSQKVVLVMFCLWTPPARLTVGLGSSKAPTF